ncbi:WG repeat-containing protein [Micromonospora wenchangensis]|uniref:WG repeat-containing protein n=1 Tax=Micromonospora wenchangensis TaxID=1185415 RepID=UPI003D71185C
MTGWSDRWDAPAEPSWVIEPTSEWHPQFPGQRYPGDLGSQYADPRGRVTASGRAEVPPLAPTRSDGTYLGRSWSDLDDRPSRPDGPRDERHGDHDPYRRLADETYRPPADEAYRRPSDEPIWQRERRQPAPGRYDDRPDVDRRTDRVSWSDRRRGGGEPAPTGWHRDRGDTDRYDSPPRPERSAPGITPVSPGRPPVSPAPRHEPPRDRPDRFTEPDWRREPDEGPPRRRTTSERPAAAPGHRVDDEPHHRAADRYDPYPAGPARGGDLPPRFREDDPPRRDADRRPAAHGHPDRWQRPLHDTPPVRPRDDTPPGPAPRHDGRSTTPAIPEERWQHPRGHDERRPAQPYEPAARHVAYPDLRPQDEPYREPWGRTDAEPRPAREPDHRREDRPAYPPRHPAEPPTRHEERPARTGPGRPGDRRPGAASAPGRPGAGTPPLDPPTGRPVSGAPVSGLPVSPAPVSSPPGSTAAGPPATGPWGPRPGPPPPPAGTRPGDSDVPAPAAGRQTPLPPDAPASPAELPTRRRHAVGRPPVPAPDQATPVSAPPAARLHLEFRRPPESTPPADRPTGRPPADRPTDPGGARHPSAAPTGPGTDRPADPGTTGHLPAASAVAPGTDRPAGPSATGHPPAAPATDRPALEITPDRPRRYVPPAPESGGTDRPGSAARPPSEGTAAWFRPGRSTPTPATPTDRTTAAGTTPGPATAGRPAAPDGSSTGGTEVPVPRSPAPPTHPTDPAPVPAEVTGVPGRSTIPAGDPADPGGWPAGTAGAQPHTVDGPAGVGAVAGPPGAGRPVPATPDAPLDAPDPFGEILRTAGSGPAATPDPATPLDVPGGMNPQNRSGAVDVDAGPTRKSTPVAPTGTDPAGDHAVPAVVSDRAVPVSPAPVTGSTVTDLPGSAPPETARSGSASPGTATAPPTGTATAGVVGTVVGRDDDPARTRPTAPGPAGTTAPDDGAVRTGPGDTASAGTGPDGTGTGDDEPSRTAPTRTDAVGTGPGSAVTVGTGSASALTVGTGPGGTEPGGGGPAAAVTGGEQQGPPSPDRTVPVSPGATADRPAPPDRADATDPVAAEDRAGTTDRPAGTDRTPTPDRTDPDDQATVPDRPADTDRLAGTDRPADTDPRTDPDRAGTEQREATGDRVTEDRAAAAGPGVGTPAGSGDTATAVRPADPEQVLAGYRWRLDPQTLREVVDDPAELRVVRRRLTEKLASALDNRARARLLSLRAVLSRLVDDLDDAVADGRLALTYAEATGELRRTALARARLAEALRWKGEFTEADRLFTEANSTELPDRLRSALHEHAGRSCYDQGRLIEACGHFERALDLHRAEDAELTDRIAVCLDAVYAHAAARGGFGPYPRSRDEVRHGRRSPRPTHDGQGRWGYADTDGELVVDYRYVEAQPFHERMAWVRRPDQAGWELIDETGGVLLGPAYARVLAFSDGLAWVSQGGEADWSAIEPDGTVVVPAGFEEVRPFRAGVAAVRRGGWGAVDRHGRLVVPPRYHGIDTTLSDGRRLDGFTDEGLAVVELAGRRGVLDRTGTVLVRPVHPALVVHPVAFLVGDGMNHWGALDRRGEPLIPPVHPDWDTVVAEIDRLLADTHPVL